MNNIYLPEDTTYNKCYVVQNEDVIRGYDRVPSNNTNYNYRDYYINSNYIYKDGTGQWSQYTSLPICLDNNVITNDIYYRNDFPDILVMFLIICLFGFYIPLKIFSKLFKKHNKNIRKIITIINIISNDIII